jgi:hypothetical protein
MHSSIQTARDYLSNEEDLQISHSAGHELHNGAALTIWKQRSQLAMAMCTASSEISKTLPTTSKRQLRTSQTSNIHRTSLQKKEQPLPPRWLANCQLHTSTSCKQGHYDALNYCEKENDTSPKVKKKDTWRLRRQVKSKPHLRSSNATSTCRTVMWNPATYQRSNMNSWRSRLWLKSLCKNCHTDNVGIIIVISCRRILHRRRHPDGL